jgi:hypothetical protein
MFNELYRLDNEGKDSEEIKPEHFDHIFNLIDEDETGQVPMAQFLKIFEVYELYKYEQGKSALF